MTTIERWLDFSQAFDHPVSVGVVNAIVAGLVFASIGIRLAKKRSLIGEETYDELIARTRSWYVLSAAMVVPILLGAIWAWLFFFLLSLFCYREFAKVTGLTQNRLAYQSVFLPITLTFFAALDHWMGLFTASWILGICWIAGIGLLSDRPAGYLRRTSLAIVGFALFGIGMGHLAFITNDVLFRPMLLWLLIFIELNDVFAYICGKSFGSRKLLPQTSPNKTIGGAVGAILVTTTLVAIVGRFVFDGTTLQDWPSLILLGILISVLGQCGDLVISSIKRDIGIKDTSNLIPGHGGLLDRFDSLLMVAPVAFHFINYQYQIGHAQTTQLFTAIFNP